MLFICLDCFGVSGKVWETSAAFLSNVIDTILINWLQSLFSETMTQLLNIILLWAFSCRNFLLSIELRDTRQTNRSADRNVHLLVDERQAKYANLASYCVSSVRDACYPLPSDNVCRCSSAEGQKFRPNKDGGYSRVTGSGFVFRFVFGASRTARHVPSSSVIGRRLFVDSHQFNK